MMDTRAVSNEALESVRPKLPTIRNTVLAEFLSAGPGGLTCDAVEERLDGRHQTISARVHELARSGHIVDSGGRRATRSGRKATVWVARNQLVLF